MRVFPDWKYSLLFCLLFCLPMSAQDKGKEEKEEEKSSRVKFVFKNNPSLRFGKIFRVDFRTKLQGDVRAFSPDITTDEGEFDIQRVRFGLEGNFLKDFEYEVEREFRQSFGGRTSKNRWRDADLNIRHFRNFQVRIGKFKAPFSMERLTSAHKLDFVLRSRIADDLAPGRDVGASVHGRFFERGLNYEVGVFRRDGEDENAESIDAETRGERMYAARVTGTPLGLLPVPKIAKDLELGIASTSSNIPEGLSGMRGKTASGHTFFRRVYVDGTRFRLGTELNWSPGPFSIKSEFIHVRDDRSKQSIRATDLPPFIARGWYLTGTWAITGEKNADGIQPRHSLFVDRGIGAIQLAARYEQLRFGSSQHIGTPSRSPRASNILGNSDRVWTLGANWYLNSFIKVQVNGVHDKIEDTQRSPISDRANYWMGILRLQFVM
jgi:phosphate-selective porin OprO/OprP